MKIRKRGASREIHFSIAYPRQKQWQNLARGVPFLRIKEKVLGKKYELSVVFVSPQKIRILNRTYRKKDTPTDILSFGLSKTSGELYLCMREIAKKAELFEMTEHGYLGFLFIHGLLHLEGMDHGRTMERLERKFCRLFHFPSPS